jgi:hypothetical protein
MIRSFLSSTALALILAVVLATPAVATARVPQGFVGMVADGPLFASGTNLPRQFETMVSAGVESVRVVFSWSSAQPFASWADVPPARQGAFAPGAVPTTFAATDQVVGDAARRGLQLMPVVVYAPAWDVAPHDASQLGRPAQEGPYASYLVMLVDRYGPRGSYWTSHPHIPKQPIRMWQIWNEPNNPYFWPDQPFAPTYVSLLRAAHDAIKREDPGAKVILGGLPNYSWKSLQQIYEVSGSRPLFDVVAVHPYTAQPQGVITLLKLVRAVMDRYGDRHKPMNVTEVGWPSSLGQAAGHHPFETTEAGQATRVSQLLPLLASNRAKLGLAGFDYYTWAGRQHRHGYWFFYAGLLAIGPSGQLRAKPAFAAFGRSALALERCKRKSSSALRCARSG